jgi:hypothetical protein
MGELFFLKQYGERRTGTNALRALIAANFPNVVVLMHLLGNKHSPPVALDALWHEVQGSDDAAFELVSRATFDAPSLTTVRNDRCGMKTSCAIPKRSCERSRRSLVASETMAADSHASPDSIVPGSCGRASA